MTSAHLIIAEASNAVQRSGVTIIGGSGKLIKDDTWETVVEFKAISGGRSVMAKRDKRRSEWKIYD